MHWDFIADCLTELRRELAACGIPLLVVHGEAVVTLEVLQRFTRFQHLTSHEETGNDLTFQRDRAVNRWAKHRGISWNEFPTNGVVRRLNSRDGWSSVWHRRMRGAPLPPPNTAAPLPPYWTTSPLPSAADLGIDSIADRSPTRLRGGSRRAQRLLESFLAGRGKGYVRGMSNPNTAWSDCSRLSPYFAFGCFSMREAIQRTREATDHYRSLAAAERPIPLGAISSFRSRCQWRCHFIQKLESEPEIEFHDMHRAFAGIRDNGPDDSVLDRFLQGQTGYPFVDACIRSLRHTGWINFRMRAMLTSFAAYHLWIDWRRLRDPLARFFIDYEPGIHYSQLQMQSGVTGINTVRIYSPVKQSLDQDPDAVFIRCWIPELLNQAAAVLHDPWKHDVAYHPPIVDAKAALAQARERIGAVRRSAGFRNENQRVYKKHGSRKGRSRNRVAGQGADEFNVRSKRKANEPKQLELQL